MRVWIGELELTKLPREFSVPAGYEHGWVLVRKAGKPLGWLILSGNRSPLDSSALRDEVLRQRGYEVTREIFIRDCLPEEPAFEKLDPISVVVCTRDRAEQLRGCLGRLLDLDYPLYEILVVDNAPAAGETRRVAAEFGVRCVREDRPGLDRARNRGVVEAGHEIVAFIDDDARADRGWLRALAQTFADPEVQAVTGAVLPFELETPAQLYFEQTYGGMGKGFLPCNRTRSSLSVRQLLWASAFGVGANMAFRRSLFSQAGFFDVALDVGTAARGGGDVEFFHRVVAQGHLLRYQPEAIVWHVHRREFKALKRQIFGNGCSVIPYLFTCLRNRTVSPRHLARYALKDVLGWWILGRLLRPRGHRRSLVLWELAGFFYGLPACLLARRSARKLSAVPQPGFSGAMEKRNSVPAMRTTIVSGSPTPSHDDG